MVNKSRQLRNIGTQTYSYNGWVNRGWYVIYRTTWSSINLGDLQRSLQLFEVVDSHIYKYMPTSYVTNKNISQQSTLYVCPVLHHKILCIFVTGGSYARVMQPACLCCRISWPCSRTVQQEVKDEANHQVKTWQLYILLLFPAVKLRRRAHCT